MRLLHWLLARRVVVPGNLIRYRLFAIPGTRSYRIYLHHFIGRDPDRALHDHPKRFTVIGLRGGYTEEVMFRRQPWARGTYQVKWRAPWVRSFPAEHIHKIADCLPNTWTLVFVGRVVREWGFWIARKWVPWRDYHYPAS